MEEKDSYIFIGTEYFLSSKSTAFCYLKLNNEIGHVEIKYIFDLGHEEFLSNNNIYHLDNKVFNKIVNTKVFDNNGIPGIISKMVPDNICRDFVYIYNELTNDYTFSDSFAINHINEEYKLRIKERVI